MTIRAFCITEDPDRPTIATFIGLHRSGVELTVACPHAAVESRNELAAAGVRLADIEFERGIDLDAIGRLRKALVSGRVDILHVFGNKGLQNGLLASIGLEVRIVAYRGIVGNVSFLSPVSWMRFLNPRIDRIVCVADAVRDYFLAMRPRFLRLPPERLVRIYKGHSLDWYRAAPADLTALGVPNDAFVIGCVANYRPRKGIEYLIGALAELPDDAHLLLIGRMEGPRLEHAVAASPARARIHRLGHRRDAPTLTAACDVFVLPSVKREGLARSLIEAMAYGIAPVVTDCGGSPELVVDGDSGLVVPVRDSPALARAIRTLYDDPALRVRLGAAARARIRDSFRIEDTIRETLELYRSLVAPDATA